MNIELRKEELMKIAEEKIKQGEDFSNIKIVLGDITQFDGDAIVNAANTHLRHGGGVCGAIFNAAGPRVLQKACDEIGYCKPGNAVITAGFNLSAKNIIHAVGPIYKDDETSSPLLIETYVSIFELAKKENIKSIALSSLSTGIFGYPIEEAVPLAITISIIYANQFDNIYFYILPTSLKTFNVYCKELLKYRELSDMIDICPNNYLKQENLFDYLRDNEIISRSYNYINTNKYELNTQITYTLTQAYRASKIEGLSDAQYIQFPNESFSTIDLDFNKFPNLNYVYYRGSKYVGTIENPYLILVKAYPDEYNRFLLHETTINVATDAFRHIDIDGNPKKQYYESIIIFKNFDGDIKYFSFADSKFILLEGLASSYFLSQLDWIYRSDYIVAPKLKLNEISNKAKSVKKPLINGYICYKDTYSYSEDVISTYEKYIKRHYIELLDYGILHPKVLEYIIEKEYVTASDVEVLLSKTKDYPSLNNKLNEYKIKKNYEIEEHDLNSLFDVYDIVSIDNTYDLKYAPTVQHQIYASLMTIAAKNKHINYCKTFLKENDIFIGLYKDREVVFLQIQKNHHPKYLTINDVMKYLNKDSGQIEFIPSSNSLIISNEKYELMDEYRIMTQNKFVSSEKLTYCLHMGLFRQNMKNGKYFEINYFNNSQDVIITKEMINYFEPFYYGNLDSKFNPESTMNSVLFRKVLSYSDIIYYLNNPNTDLLLDIVEVKCGIMKPYFKIENVNAYYTCKKGTKYLLSDLLKYISKRLVVTDRTMNLNLLNMEFSGYYGNFLTTKYKDITKNELKEILDKYFYFECNRGCYHSCDTVIEKDNDLIFYDKEWFKLFYDGVNKNLNVKKITDIMIKAPYQRKFNLKVIPKNDLNFFIETTKLFSSYELYIEKIGEFIVENIDRL